MTLKVGIFTNVMLAATTLWLLPEWFDFVAARFAGARRALSALPGGAATELTPVRAVVLAVAAVLFAAAIIDPVAPTHMPRGTRPLLASLGLDLKIALFVGGIPSQRWVADGALADGTHVNPLETVAPGTIANGGFRNSLWMQLPYRLTDYAAFGRFVCRRFNEQASGAPLRTWNLTTLTRQPYPPGAPIPAETSELVLTQTCA
jgi:hypothetical protein